MNRQFNEIKRNLQRGNGYRRYRQWYDSCRIVGVGGMQKRNPDGTAKNALDPR